MGKSLVLYVSFTGTTRKLAEKIGEMSGGEVVEIRAKEPYSAEDLDWTSAGSRCSQEHENPEMRPGILGMEEILEKISGVETVYVGFPTWWGTAPNIIRTLLDEMKVAGEAANLGDLSPAGKKVRIFTTSGGTGIEEVMGNMKKDYAFIRDGFQTGGEIDEVKLKAWMGDE